jgi:hypothetical protein
MLTTFTPSATFHLPLNLMTPIPRNVLSDVYASGQLELSPLNEVASSASPYKLFRDVLDKLRGKLYVNGQPRKKVLRVVVYELGGPEWGDAATSTVSNAVSCIFCCRTNEPKSYPCTGHPPVPSLAPVSPSNRARSDVHHCSSLGPDNVPRSAILLRSRRRQG